MMTGRIEEIVGGITEQLEVKNAARDQALLDSRHLTRQAALAIRALHRGDRDEPERRISEARDIVARIREDLIKYPDLYWAGYVQDSQKEYVEAALVSALMNGTRIPAPNELGVEPAAYLNGMAEAATEMRRYVLDIIRHGTGGDQAEAERVLDLMDEIYTALTTVDFPDTLTGGLRRTTDVVRGVLERTRGDLTMSLRQARLERALASNVAQ